MSTHNYVFMENWEKIILLNPLLFEAMEACVLHNTSLSSYLY